MLTVFALLLLRSLRWSLLVLVPPLSGIVFYFGTMGWLGIAFSPFTLFMVAAMMGVSNDDILFFALFLTRQRRRMGFREALQASVAMTAKPILQTTTIISVSMAALVLSHFTNTAREGLLGAASFLFCTLVTYTVIPTALARKEKP